MNQRAIAARADYCTYTVGKMAPTKPLRSNSNTTNEIAIKGNWMAAMAPMDPLVLMVAIVSLALFE
jgi:hypothetical protein